MTKRECAVVMAHTGVTMLTGDNYRAFQEYVEEILKRPMRWKSMLEAENLFKEIREKSSSDFLKLCNGGTLNDF